MGPKPQTPDKIKQAPLNPAQDAAVHAPGVPLLIVAGAGTGKTKTLTSRIIHLIEAGTPPERICAITFTNKAAKEMAKRVNRTGPFLGTFHSLGAKILRKECRLAGRDPNFAIFDDHDSFDLIKKAVKAVLPPKKDDEDDGILAKKNKKDTPVYFAKKISELKNLGKLLPEARPSVEKEAQVRRVFEKYEAALERNNAFDFDDLIEKTVMILSTHPDVLKKYQRMFDAILVDEYQDINPKQYELVSLLAGEHRNLSVVGDDEQTIYSWRYADIKTFLNFDKEWKGASVYFLEENYRSTGTIIRAAAAVAKNNRFRTPKNLWTQNPDGDRIVLFEAWGENEEAEWIAMQIYSLRAKNKNADIGILYRTNAQSRAIEQALIRNNIPYRIFGGLKFYERREIKDAVSALRYISNAKDEPARERLEKNLTKRRFAEFKNKVAELQDPTRGGVASEIASAGKIAPLAALKLFLETFGYFEYLESNFINSDEREENIAELIAFATDFDSLDELLERLSLLQAADEIGNKPVDGREVNLMTIHLAKGLEFDSVFIAGVAEGLLPHGRSLDDENALEEERRLMYVAMTRARKNLYLSFYGIASRFIGEIPEDCITLAAGDESEDSSDGSDGALRRRNNAATNNNDYDGGEHDEYEHFISLD
ncbi:MAG TPA: UvrD-helicase domain-containing protein [Candidatus Paceibacterota bacterium]|nr:UvrD-helicase domain-containing protein [Candidatus Paceibacterota bacterium]